MKRVKPHITPTIHLMKAKGTNPNYHYNSADNMEMLRRWREYPQNDIVEKVPIQLDIETTSRCNLECPMCFQAYDETKPTMLDMPRGLYNHIIDEFSAKGGMTVKLMYRGDPLMTKDIPDWVKYATDRNIQATFNTNGILLNENRSAQLIEAGLRQILFSIDSHIPEEYNQIRRPKKNKLGNFDRVLKNVKDLRRIRDEKNSRYPLIEVSRVDLPETRESMNDFKDFWLTNGAEYVSFVSLNDYSMGKEGKMLVSNEFCCEMPWQRMFILSDGIVTQCCGDLYQQYPLGQLATPEQIKEYELKLEEIVGDDRRPGMKVKANIISSKKLNKDVIGFVQENGSVKASKMRVQGITGNVDIVPVYSSIEEIWLGNAAEHMRKTNRRGLAHLIKACADCGYRETTIRNANLKHVIRDRKLSPKKKGKIKYFDEGLKR